ncbi:MAG TPA: HAD family hydrolase [Ancylobacter sp.]
MLQVDLNGRFFVMDSIIPADPRLQDGIGCWLERLTVNVTEGRPALFLDRDGVIVEETHYLCSPADVRLMDGVAEIIARCNARNIPVIVVTNQAGIARGYYGWHEFEAVQAEIMRRLAMAGARLDLVLACAYHHEGNAPYVVSGHAWRKPNPGMIRAAAELLAVDLSRSVIVGDKISDLDAGAAAGLVRGMLVLSGYGRSEQAALHSSGRVQDAAFSVEDDLAGAVEAYFRSVT